MALKIEVEQNQTIDDLLKELQASPQRRGSILSRSFNEGLKIFYEEILGSYQKNGIPVWSGWAKSAFDSLANDYDVDINWTSDPSLQVKPNRMFVNTATAPQASERITGNTGEWSWELILDIRDPKTGQPYVEINETVDQGTKQNFQRDRAWNLFENARKIAVREINATVQRRLDNFVQTRKRAVRGSRSRI